MSPGSRNILCGAGLVAQLVGLACLLRGGVPEINLGLALLLYLPGTIAVMYVLEDRAEHQGRSGAWALAALLGPLGVGMVALLKPGSPPAVPAPELALRVRSRLDRISALVLTVLVVLGLAWTAWAGWRCIRGPPIVTGRFMRSAELKAYRRLQVIQTAQERYKQRDWDHDGRTTYASYLVHLWQSVDALGRPLPVRLLPRRLAFAMGEEFALDGYFYRSLNLREPPQGASGLSLEDLPRLNPETEWALVAAPLAPHQTGLLSFLTDQSGRIWAHSGIWGGDLRAVPRDAAAGGWIQLASEQALKEMQKRLSYQDREIRGLPKLHLRWQH